MRAPTPLIAVNFSALVESSGDALIWTSMSKLSCSICFLICLINLRFNIRTKESPKRAPRPAGLVAPVIVRVYFTRPRAGADQTNRRS